MSCNFFLLNESLNTNSIAELETGISNLNDIAILKDAATDSFLVHDSIWMHNNGHGRIVDFYYSIVSLETQRIIPIVFAAFDNCLVNITSEIIFDATYPNDCNGFTGINFIDTAIPLPRQITTGNSFTLYKNACALAVANQYQSVQDFWDSRAILFPNLVFCDSVLAQIQVFSTNDERFKRIEEKLKRLNTYTGNWIGGVFDYKNLGLDNSPDTPKRVEDTLELRTFACPEIGDRVFSLHIKWSFGRKFFRLYYFPEENNHKVYVGYIGGKDEIGF